MKKLTGLILIAVLLAPAVWAQDASVSISDEQRACGVTNDCLRVDPSCSACGLLDVIAKKNKDWFNQAKNQVCVGYAGSICDAQYDPRAVTCQKDPGAQNGLCVLVDPTEVQPQLIKQLINETENSGQGNHAFGFKLKLGRAAYGAGEAIDGTCIFANASDKPLVVKWTLRPLVLADADAGAGRIMLLADGNERTGFEWITLKPHATKEKKISLRNELKISQSPYYLSLRISWGFSDEVDAREFISKPVRFNIAESE